jgi:AcrR family transcriptional regulator
MKLQKKKPEIEKLIIKIARKHFLKNGYNGTKISDISREAGLSSVNMIYTYFKDGKKDLFNSVTSSVTMDLSGATRDPELFCMKLEESGRLSEKISKLEPEILVRLI